MDTPTATEAPPPQPDIPLRDEVRAMIAVFDRADADQAADAIMQLLMERGHYMPGMPPARRILDDAKSFAERLTLSNLALRCFAMLGALLVETPETKPAKRWIIDYIEGKGHGPVGHPMLWPAKLPGLASMLTSWGFEPTPTTPPFVARSLPHPTQQ
jgi:hypothetical protein